MHDVKLNLNDKAHGAFYIMDGAEHMGEMVVGISGSNLTGYHTGVSTKAEGKRYAKKMLNAMVKHAQTNHLKVIPLCRYVHAQFTRHPEEYANVWPKEQENKSDN